MYIIYNIYPYQVKAEFAGKNPMKEVPCIEIDGHLLTQSIVIYIYIYIYIYIHIYR